MTFPFCSRLRMAEAIARARLFPIFSGWAAVLFVQALLWCVPSGTCLASPTGIEVYAGGVVGLDALTNAEASTKFRQAGGGLYLHNNGWTALTSLQQRQVLAVFQDRPIALELGFKEGGEPWAQRLASGYLALGIKPSFIAANAFDGNNHPTPEQWRSFSKTLRAAGLPATTQVLPTFEYANFGPNVATLASNTVTLRADFQDIIRTAGGIVLDTPPGYALAREENYRAWIFDAIRWTRQQKLTVVWIASPHTSYHDFRSDTVRFLRLLAQHDALPTIVVSENYAANPPGDYPNVVGQEDQPDSTLGVAWYLLSVGLPDITAKGSPAGR
jgi:hypothetical protein